MYHIYYHLQTKFEGLGQGTVFTHVCHSVHGWGSLHRGGEGLHPERGDLHPIGGLYPKGGLHPGELILFTGGRPDRDPPLDRYPLR